MEAALLHCPIRGSLRVSQRAADQLTFTEEKQRIDAIRYLLQKQYPKENFGIETMLFRLGNAGRNSFRTDFAIYDRAFADLQGLPLEKRLEHLKVLAEIKRDGTTAEDAKATQVRSALSLTPDIETLGVYWDDLEQRFFYRSIEGRRSIVREAPISKIPSWGSGVGSTQLALDDLVPAKDLVQVFDKIEDAFHAYVVDKTERYTLIQQLLLLKIHDENLHRTERRRHIPLDFQDYSAEALSDEEVAKRLNAALGRAAAHYNLYLPPDKQIAQKFECETEVLRNASKLLAPVNVLGSKTQVIQQFYMKFAKSLYKWDLAQYFTPHEVIDFIVEMTNPKPGEHVYDPACGSADFLISAFRRVGTASETSVWGADNSKQAVQISILNMVLNGDGKTQISAEDSLSAFSAQGRQFSIVLCNPPFGTKILERRYEVLRKFDMGHRWDRKAIGAEKTDEVRKSQQTGILFAELCVRLARPDGGRIGIILPNGYLGNRSVEYVALREWLLRHTKIVAIVAFPRFTFKKSGADVSASVLVLERRATPLASAKDSADYAFFAGNIQSVGWRAGDKTGSPIYVRDEETGELALDDRNEPVLDADFAQVLGEFLHSPAADCFPWVADERDVPTGAQTRGVDIELVAGTSDLNLDPKRHSGKYFALRKSIEEIPHFRLGDVLDAVPNARPRIDRAKTYKYVEIEKVGVGDYDHVELRGWQLPQRAKLSVIPGDVFIPHLWSCAGKWFIAAGNCEDVIVTNGCTRLRVKEGKRGMVRDLVVGLCSEAFAVQLRALSTGSDGLAEISDDDLLEVKLPLLGEQAERMIPRIDALLSGESRFSQVARSLISDLPDFPIPPSRKFHGSLI
jgi:type I restriction enzyme M protein